jgi:eight-cysteine-cluster-containing protein
LHARYDAAGQEMTMRVLPSFSVLGLVLSLGFGLVLSAGSACTGEVPTASAETTPASSGDRTPAVPKDSPHYDLFEGTSHPNQCEKDSDCFIGGCSREVCSADAKVKTPCIAHADKPTGASCGCVKNECLWYR